jgi:hypothetical protein
MSRTNARSAVSTFARRKADRPAGRLAGRRAVQILPREILVSVRALAFAFLLAAVAAPAAEPPKGVKVVQEPDKIIVRKRTVVDFGDVTVEGELLKPEGSYLLHRNKTRFKPLIELRNDFDAELRRSADNL